MRIGSVATRCSPTGSRSVEVGYESAGRARTRLPPIFEGSSGPWAAYSQSKTANVLLAVEIARRWARDRITANAVNPGRISSTGLIRSTSPLAMVSGPKGGGEPGVSVKNIAQGAATSVLLAGSPLVEGVTGRYFEDCQEAGAVVPGIRRGVAAHAIDPHNAARLWALTEELLTDSVVG